MHYCFHHIPKTGGSSLRKRLEDRAGKGQISKLDYEISIKEHSIQKARLSPSASIKVSKSENKDFSTSVDDQDDETLKATITWPIIKGGENISSIKKSSLDKERFKLILKDTEIKINSETSNSRF